MHESQTMLFFGGAFNPPTRAHIELAEFAMRAAGKDGVIFMPSKMSYIRDDQGKDFAFDDEKRLAMLRSVAANRRWMHVSDYEIRAAKQPRTYESLCRLREEGLNCSLLIGSDKLVELSTKWRHVSEICREFGVVCMVRGTDNCEAMIREDPFLDSLKEHICLITTPQELRGMSSTAVRRALLTGNEMMVRGSVPQEIADMLLADE